MAAKNGGFSFALLADLHFGSVPEGLAAALLDDIESAAPHLAIIAGDLTMRARAAEFAAAAEWIGALKTPYMVLPGNHDLPYVNLWERFFNPYRRYSAAVNTALNPIYDDGAHVIAGLNTTRSWQPHTYWQEGVVRRHDAAEAVTALSSEAALFKAVAAHHPLLPVRGMPRARPALRAGEAAERLAGAGAEMFMSGHVHVSFCHEMEVGGRTLLAIGAPTALSNRLRGEENGYWLIAVSPSFIELTLRRRRGASFEPLPVQRFARQTPAAQGAADVRRSQAHVV